MDRQTYTIKSVELKERQIFKWTRKSTIFSTVREEDGSITHRGPILEDMTYRVYIVKGRIYYTTDARSATLFGKTATPDMLDQDEATRIEATDRFID